jgi:DNA-directed RNA polymerase
MTTVYGVTKYGARHQILKQLKDIPEFPEKYQWSASIYLTETVFKCLEKMFTSSKQIQVCNLKSSDFMKKVPTVLPISTKQTLTSRINNWT